MQNREGGALPVWELAANETDCMIGYHAVPVIADAYAKGIRGYDVNAALGAMVASANRDVRGLKSYREQGFVPADEEGESVSKTLEYAYDDWCIAEMARSMGRHEVAREFRERAESWMNLLDPATGFMRPRRNDTWIEPFDPAEVNSHLTEANTWQYTFFVPHDVVRLATLLGGREAFTAKLDALFAAASETKGRDQADITGLIGQYAHGNEPSHHMAYLYDFVGEPWKTQQRVRRIVDTLYSDKPDGVCGNEDCGQMSAWYVLSALGFYPVCPGRPEYAIGTPLFPEATIRADGAHPFVIRANSAGPYVQGATLDGSPLGAPSIDHAAIVRGGSLDFSMGAAPSKWGCEVATAMPAASITPVPFVVRGDRVFAQYTELELAVLPRFRGGLARAFDDPTPYPALIEPHVLYSLNGGEFRRYEAPFRIDTTTDLVVYGNDPGPGYATGSVSGRPVRSKSASARFVKLAHSWKLTLEHPYAPQYAANGDVTLIDGLRGGGDFRTGDWQGFQGVDVDATIDLGSVRELKGIRAGFLQETRSWIWLPTEVRFLVSDDGKTFRDLGAIECTVDERDETTQPLVFEFRTAARARFVRVVGKNRGTCPDWHPGVGKKAWLFADEIGIDVAE